MACQLQSLYTPIQIRRGVRPWQRPETDDRRTTVKEVNQLSVAISSIRIELINKLFAFCNNIAMKRVRWIDVLCRGLEAKRYGMQPAMQKHSRQIQDKLIYMIDWNLIWKDALLTFRLTEDSCYGLEEGVQSYDCSENIRADGKRRVTALELDLSWRC